MACTSQVIFSSEVCVIVRNLLSESNSVDGIALGEQISHDHTNLAREDHLGRACHHVELWPGLCAGVFSAGGLVVPAPQSVAGLSYTAGVEKSLDTARTSACATSAARIWHGYFTTRP